MAVEELQEPRPGWANLLTRDSTFLGCLWTWASSWYSPEELDLMEEARWGVGGGPLFPKEPVDEVEGDFLLGEHISEGGRGGGRGNSGD